MIRGHVYSNSGVDLRVRFLDPDTGDVAVVQEPVVFTIKPPTASADTADAVGPSSDGWYSTTYLVTGAGEYFVRAQDSGAKPAVVEDSFRVHPTSV